jgi:hypothetical protein
MAGSNAMAPPALRLRCHYRYMRWTVAEPHRKIAREA